MFWRKTRFWMFLVLIVFGVNVFVAFVTLHRGHNDHDNGRIDNRVWSSSSWSSVSSIDNDIMFPTLSSSFLRRGEPPTSRETRVTENEYWSRILNRSRSFTGDVQRKGISHTPSNNNTQYTHSMFAKDIESYLSRNGELPSCVVPPQTPMCRTNHYTVVMYSTDLEGKRPTSSTNQRLQRPPSVPSRFRPLVTRIMTLLSYPSVASIVLILNVDDDTLRQDTQYGERIVQWREQDTIKVLQVSSSLWEAIPQVQGLVVTDSVLWMDGDHSKDWTGTLFKSTLHAWRENPSRMVVHDDYSLPMGYDSNNGPCPVRLPTLHGLMMHKSYLCLLDHPILSHFQRHLWTSDASSSSMWNVTTISIALMLLYTSHGYITNVPVPKTTTTPATNNNNNNNGTLTPTVVDDQRLLPLLEYLSYDCLADSRASPYPYDRSCR
jgi:hypothetical protein